MAKTKKYSISEARSNLPSLVREAEAGFEVELSRRGKSVAVLISIREFQRLHGDRPGFTAAYKRFLEDHSLKDAGLEEDFIESLRAREAGREVPL
jgi:prevent-host-death family protein